MRSAFSGKHGEPDPGRVRHRVGERGGDRVVRALAHRFRAERAEPVRGLRRTSPRCAARRQRPGCDSCGTTGSTTRPSGPITTLLVERGAERLGDAAFDLAAALHGIDDEAGIGRMHAAQNPDLAGMRVHRDPEALHVERDRARGAGAGAGCGEFAAGRLGGAGQRGKADAASAADDRIGRERSTSPRSPPACSAANAAISSRRRSAARLVASPATTVPVLPNAPVSWPTWSVSDCRMRTRAAVVPSAVAAIWAWTVVVPLPNSAVPTTSS